MALNLCSWPVICPPQPRPRPCPRPPVASFGTPQTLLYNIPGVYTLTIGTDVPVTVKGFEVEIWAAGASGAITISGEGQSYGGSGGGGAYALLSGIDVKNNGKRFRFKVGAGGAFPIGSAPADGADGENSNFTSLDNSSIHIVAHGGQGGSSIMPGVAGGAGGIVTGTADPPVSLVSIPGTEGASGGATSGTGGSSAFGGAPGTQGYFTNGVNLPGTRPQFPGAGGSGTTALTGSIQPFAGANGCVRIRYIA